MNNITYDIELADKIRKYLSEVPNIAVEEKKMFGGLTFMVNGKMCINVSDQNLMCRFDPALQEDISKRKGYKKMIMKGKEYKGYCYIQPEGLKTQQDIEYFINICLAYNKIAKSTKK